MTRLQTVERLLFEWHRSGNRQECPVTSRYSAWSSRRTRLSMCPSHPNAVMTRAGQPATFLTLGEIVPTLG
eukprot:3494961-Rhodomonas_salina.3